MLSLTVLYALNKHVLKPSYRYFVRTRESNKRLKSIGETTEKLQLYTDEFAVTLLDDSERHIKISNAEYTLNLELDALYTQLGIDPASLQTAFLPGIWTLTNEELNGLRDMPDILEIPGFPPGLNDSSTPGSWPSADQLNNGGLLNIPDNAADEQRSALEKINNLVLSRQCSEACVESNNPAQTAKSVLEKLSRDYLVNHRPDSSTYKACKIQQVLRGEPNGCRYSKLCDALDITATADPGELLFFLLNQLSISSAITERGQLANGRMRHNIQYSCITRINQAPLDFSLPMCLALSQSSIVKYLHKKYPASPELRKTRSRPPTMSPTPSDRLMSEVVESRHLLETKKGTRLLFGPYYPSKKRRSRASRSLPGLKP